jgi:hypothetical protein
MARNEQGPFLFWVMILTGRPWKSMSLSAHSSFITSRSSLGAVDGARDEDGAGGGSGASSWEGSTTAAADMTGAVKRRALGLTLLSLSHHIMPPVLKRIILRPLCPLGIERLFQNSPRGGFRGLLSRRPKAEITLRTEPLGQTSRC